MKLRDGAFTGSKEQGNPYEGPEEGIEYDTNEANTHYFVQGAKGITSLNMYRFDARQLIKHFSAEEGQKIMEVGSGTGISTLELISSHPYINVTGIEKSKDMFQVALYKFHKTGGEGLLGYIDDGKLLTYWEVFRQESQPYTERVQFVQGNFEEICFTEPESFDGAIASQSMHWMDLNKAFSQLHKYLKHKGRIVWSTASHFCEDPNIPSLEFGMRYNNFLVYVLDEVSKKVDVEHYYKSLSRPKYDIDSIVGTISKYGFETKHLGTYPEFFDFQILLEDVFPACVRELIVPDISAKRKDKIINKAIATALKNPKALKDRKHKYEIVPIFISEKV